MIVWKYILLVQVLLTDLNQIITTILPCYHIIHKKFTRVGKSQILGRRKKSQVLQQMSFRINKSCILFLPPESLLDEQRKEHLAKKYITFLLLVVTNYHKFMIKEQYKSIFLQFWEAEIQSGLAGPCFSWRLQGGIHSLACPRFQRLPAFPVSRLHLL